MFVCRVSFRDLGLLRYFHRFGRRPCYWFSAGCILRCSGSFDVNGVCALEMRSVGVCWGIVDWFVSVLVVLLGRFLREVKFVVEAGCDISKRAFFVDPSRFSSLGFLPARVIPLSICCVGAISVLVTGYKHSYDW